MGVLQKDAFEVWTACWQYRLMCLEGFAYAGQSNIAQCFPSQQGTQDIRQVVWMIVPAEDVLLVHLVYLHFRPYNQTSCCLSPYSHQKPAWLLLPLYFSFFYLSLSTLSVLNQPKYTRFLRSVYEFTSTTHLSLSNYYFWEASLRELKYFGAYRILKQL